MKKVLSIIVIILSIIVVWLFLSYLRAVFSNEPAGSFDTETVYEYDDVDDTPQPISVSTLNVGSVDNSMTSGGIIQRDIIDTYPTMKCRPDEDATKEITSLIDLRCHTIINTDYYSYYMSGDTTEVVQRMKSVVQDDIKSGEDITTLDDKKVSQYIAQMRAEHTQWTEENKQQPRNVHFFRMDLESINTFQDEYEKFDDELENSIYPLLDLTTKSAEAKVWIREKAIATRKEVLEKGEIIPFEDLDFGMTKIVHRKTFNGWEIAIIVHKFGWHGYDGPQFAEVLVATPEQIDAITKIADFISTDHILFDEHDYQGFGRDPITNTKKAPKWNTNKEVISDKLSESNISIKDNAQTNTNNIYELLYAIGRQGLSTTYNNTSSDLPETVTTDVKGFVVGDWGLIRKQLEIIYKKALINSLLFDGDSKEYITQEIKRQYETIRSKNSPQGVGYEILANTIEEIDDGGDVKTEFFIDIQHPEKIALENALLKLIFNTRYQEAREMIDDTIENNHDIKYVPYFAIKSVPIPLLIKDGHSLEYKTYNWNGGSIDSKTEGFYMELVTDEHEAEGDDHTNLGHTTKPELAEILKDEWEIFITTWSGDKNKVYTVYILRKGQFEELQRVLGILGQIVP